MTSRDAERGESLGLGLKPGDAHYRAYVGPPEDYDLIAAMAFNLLTTLGLRQHHCLLDIGCGSLRIGRLLIPYLNKGNYCGIEPNEWLVSEGVKKELGESLLQIKSPQFLFSDSPAVLSRKNSIFDFAIAQSIFSHCGLDFIGLWLGAVSCALKVTGALIATFLAGNEDSERSGWVYPECVSYRLGTLQQLANKADLQFQMLDWKHPRQQWALFAKPGFDSKWFQGKSLTWNTWLESSLGQKRPLRIMR
jgi:hypothetical protein